VITSLGSVSLAVALPGANAAGIAGSAGINAALPDIDSRIAALRAFSPAPINFSVDLTLANSIVVSISTGISGGIPVPDIDAQIALVSGLVASLETQVVSINANLSIVTSFLSTLAATGISLYAFDGPQNTLGSELGTALGSSSMHANAIILVTQNPSSWAAIQAIFKTS